MKEIELIGKRKAREKHFLKQNGVIEAQVFDENIHFLKNGMYEEIDNTLIDKGAYYTNKNNAYEVKLYKDTSDNLMEVSIDDNFIKTRILNPNLSELTENIMESKLYKNVCYSNILDNIDLEYNVLPTKVKEAIILKNKNVCVEKLVFSIETNMKLSLLENKKIIAEKDGVQIFEFDAPYMIDNEFKINNNVFYELTECDCDKYSLKIKIDEDWLKDENIKYPVMIDPTITNSGQDNSVYDTYIYPGDTGIDRNNQDMLKVGIENVDGVKKENRTLIKFDLPNIGTGSQVINAELNLYGYPQVPVNLETDLILVHQITKDWNENDANWNNMNDKYNPLVEGVIFCSRGYFDFENESVHPSNCGGDITRLVRKWYTGTPNYGIMLKYNEQKYNENLLPMFYSKSNKITGGNPKPVLSISYRNQNGIVNYMDYQTQNFSHGKSYVNNYNGNLTVIFDVGETIGVKMPINLNLVYNTNDVVLNNNIGYGLGFKLNLHQEIKEKNIDGTTYLEYSDEDGTLHYFLNQKISYDDNGYNSEDTGNIYYDEDGLNMSITKNSNDYILRDKNGNTMKFTKNENIAYLTEISDISGNKNIILYNDNNVITKLIDANNDEILIEYTNNTITINSKNKKNILKYSGNKLVNIVSPLGVISFGYDVNNVINQISDVNGLKIKYEYYDQKPFKIRKISEYGTDNTIGNHYTITYGFDSSMIIDSKGRVENRIFNSQGGLVSINSLKYKDDIKNAYGISQINGTSYYNQGTNNKLLREEIPLKYVKNLLSNTSFEENYISFEGTGHTIMSISDEAANSGLKSLKVNCTKENQIFFYKEKLEIIKGKYYTFSAYIRCTNKLKLELRYLDKESQPVVSYSNIIEPSSEFERYDVTIYYPEDSSSDLQVGFDSIESGIIYIDDIQLEEGEVANNYNLLENSDFSKGVTDWNLSVTTDEKELPINDYFEVVDISSNVKALKAKTNPAYETDISKTFNIGGKGGDVFNISFWYKNEGIQSNLSEYYGSRVYISFNYINQDDGHCGIPSPILNPNDESWQYVSNDFVAEKDYSSITLNLHREYDANDLYITNLNLFKDIRNIFYEYDEYGNVILENNLDNKSEAFNYDKNNQLIKITNPKGNKFTFEYDNLITNRVINEISDLGISNQYKYDEYNNPILTRLINNSINGELKEGLYKIRLKGDNKYLRNISNEVKVKSEDCYHDVWNLEKNGQYFKIHHSIITDKYFNIEKNNLILSTGNDESSLFEIIKNTNGSYSIKLKNEDKYLKYNDSNLEVSTLTADDYHFEFYFETIVSKIFIENTAEYTDDGKFIKSVTDSQLNKSTYDIDDVTGNIKKITDAMNGTINYGYDDKNRLISISNGNKNINYKYNNENELEKIIDGNREYSFGYDEYLNIKTIKIGKDNVLLENNYADNNGNLMSVMYGNGNSISYEYDEFDRVSKFTKMDKIFEYKYNSNGDLVKIISDSDTIKYTYDLGKKLSKYQQNNFNINFEYDHNKNIIGLKNKLYNFTNNVSNTLNDDDAIVKTVFDNVEINYNYDALGRLIDRNINNLYATSYKYLNNGRRTTFLIEEFKDGNEEYFYVYDKLNNIKFIKRNGSIYKRYFYDEYNELIKEIDYDLQQIIKYKYDEYGNILHKRVYNLKDNSLIYQNVYKYNNSWNDQLSRFNDIDILYDEIGNPTQIGNNINLTWTNGRELSTYSDESNNISYEYNNNGIRTYKNINGEKIEYYLDEMQIVYEKRGNDIIYYLYNDIDNLIGFKYNDNVFYYQRNGQDDIVGLLDSNYNIVAKYYYDSFGNILSIKNGNGVDVSKEHSHIANINPFRYRSYYYDCETGLYYLNNRYYNPLWGRFINSDMIINQNEDILGYNLYAYCSNNFINTSDYTGNGLIKNLIKKVIKLFTGSKNTKKSSSKKPSQKKAKTIKQSNAKVKVKSGTNANNKNWLPTKGTPNSTRRKDNGDLRHYGPDGKADYDTDYSHPDHHPELGNPHQHDWEWDGDKHKRGKAYDPSVGKDATKIIVGTAITAATGYFIYRGIRMLPSLLPPFWWSIPLNAVTP